MTTRSSALSPLAALTLVALSSCRSGAGHPNPAVAPDPNPRTPDAYIQLLLATDPGFARNQGAHHLDGVPNPVGPAAVEEHIRRARAYLAATAGELPAKDPQRMDVEVTRLHAQRTLFELEELRLPHLLLSYGDLFDVSAYVQRAYAPLRVRAFSVVAHLEAAAASVNQVLAMQDPVQPRTHLLTARMMLQGTVEYLSTDVARALEPALAADAALRQRFESARAGAVKALERLISFVDDALPRADEGFRLGPERFLRLLAVNEGITMDLPALHRMAEEDLTRNRAQLDEAAAQLFPGVPPLEAVARVSAEKVPAQDVMAVAERQGQELRAFITAKGLVDIPGPDVARVTVTPPFLRFNSAFLDGPGPLETVARVAFYYITPPDPAWPPQKQLDYLPYESDLLATTIHEVYPGHFVHALHRRNHPTLPGRTLGSYAFSEGWAHYTEQMVLDAGYRAGDLRARVGQLTNALLRNCRFVAALGLHTGTMTVEEARTLFMERCLVDEGNAEQQAFRGTFDPGYFSYTLGKLRILALREKYLAAHPGASWGAFHNRLLSFGSPPLGLLESRM
jgi:hypothetical protein